MSRTDPANERPVSATLRRLALGAAVAATMGTTAGAALRMEPADRGGPAAPQQIFLSEPELAALERQAGGWPARAAS